MAIVGDLPSLMAMSSSRTGKLNDADRTTIIIGSWLVSAIMLVFSNRYILIDLHFGYPLTLVAWQAFSVVFVTRAFDLHSKLTLSSNVEETPVTWDTYTTYLLPIGALLGAAPLWTTIASNTLPLWQIAILHGTTPLAAAGLSRFLGARIPVSKFIYLFVIVVALLVATVGGMKFGRYDTQLTEKQLYGAAWTGIERSLGSNLTSPVKSTMSSDDILGTGNVTLTLTEKTSASMNVDTVIALLCGLFSVAAEAGSKVLMENVLKAREDSMSPSRLLLNVAPIWLLVVSVSAIAIEGPDLTLFFGLPTGILLANGFAAIVVAYSVPAVVQMTSATTYILAESFRQTFVTFLACVIYNLPIGIFHAISFFFGFVGFAKYAEKEIPHDARRKPKDYILQPVSAADEGVDEEALDQSTEVYHEDEKAAEITGASVNLFIVLCGFMLAVLVMASMTTRPVLSPQQAINYEQNVVIPYEQTKVATIIETRNLPHLAPLILQFITVLPPDWPVVAWCSPENIEVLRQVPAIARNVADGRLDLRLFPHQFDIHDQEYLSRFLTKPWLWEALEREWILFFQSDSMLCSKSPQKIDDWLGFDWVGAPWEDSPNAKGGNGGLSLRKRSSMIKLTSNPDIAREDYGDPEDVWFSKHLHELPGVKWPTEHQAKFSVENIFGAMSEWSWRPLGVHSGGNPPATWRTEDVMNRLMDWCPELKLFYDPRKYID